MSNFKQPQKKKPVDYGDGFISSNPQIGSTNGDIRRRFSKSYSPKDPGLTSTTQNLNLVKQQAEGFGNRTNMLDNADVRQISPLDGALDNDVPKKRGFSKKFSGRSHNKKGLGKRIARGFAVSGIALVLGVGSLFGYGYIKARNIFKGNGDGAPALQANVDPAKLNGEGDGRVNILLLGKGGPGHEAPDLTDTILLASIDPVQNEAALLSIPRDMFIKDQNGNGTKINAVYSNAKRLAANNGAEDEDEIESAGLNAIKKSVTDVIGIPVHYYVMVDFEAFERSIDIVGGITVDVKEPLYDQTVAWLLGGNPLVAGEGLQTFDGERALLYARSRKGSARGDFDRTERQREIIVALQQKVLSLGTFSNPLKVIDLLDTLGDNVRTDLNGLGEVKRLYEIGQNIGPDRITSVGLADPPNVLVGTDFVGDQSVVVPLAGLYQYEDIKSYVRNTLRDPFLKREDARVIILNGTSTVGLANITEKELKSYGYNVVGIGNAPVGVYERSLLFDVSGVDKPYTKSYIERRLGYKVSETLIDGLPTKETADFVIILGEDEATKATTN
jgi:LCP family protein required for cell wall assembly